MRTLPALLVGLALALAGCTGDDDGGDSTTPPTETTPTPTPATPTAPTNETTDDNETEEDEGEPTTPPPAEVFTGTFNFAAGDAQGGATQEASFTVEEGYTSLLLNVTFTPSGLGVGNGPKVVMLDPAGTVLATCEASVPLTEAEVCEKTAAITAGGDYTIHAEGAGSMTGEATVTAV